MNSREVIAYRNYTIPFRIDEISEFSPSVVGFYRRFSLHRETCIGELINVKVTLERAGFPGF